MIIYFDFKSRNYSIESSRSGHSNLTTWRPLDHGVHLKDVSFGVVNHPFNPGEISFRRKPFSLYTNKDYGIALKGTELSQDEYHNLMADKRKVNSLVNKLFHRYGSTFWQSYPSLVKSYQDNGTFDLVKANPNSHGTSRYESHRKFPSWAMQNGMELDTPMYFQPHPVKAMRINNYNHWQIFNEGATINTWYAHHDRFNTNWREIVQEKVNAQTLAA